MTEQALLQFISASVSPAVMISGSALLILSTLNYLSMLTGRIRDLHEKALQQAEAFERTQVAYHAQRAGLCMLQAKSIFTRARAFKLTLTLQYISILAFILCCLCLGLGVFIPSAGLVAACFFVVGVAGLLSATFVALQAILRILRPLHYEQGDTDRLLKLLANIPTQEVKE